MIWQSNPYSISLAILVMIVVAWAITVWARHSHWLPGRLSLALTLLAAAWTLGDALHLASAAPNWKLFWFRVTVLIAVWLSAIWFVLAISITGQISGLRNGRWLLLTVMPLIISVLTLLDDRYHLIVTDIEFVHTGQMLHMSYDYGLALIALALYAYGLQIAAAMVFLRVAIRARQLHWRQMTTILIGWLITPGLFIVDVTHQTPAMQPRLLPLSIITAFPIVMWGFNRIRRADFARVARGTLIDKLPDPVIVLDAHGIVLDLNPKAELLFNCTLGERIGDPISKLDANLGSMMGAFAAAEDQTLLAEFTRDQHIFDIRRTTMTDWRNKVVGHAVVLRDITERTIMERNLLLTQFCVDQASIGIMRTGADARILSVNRQWCEALGYTTQELCAMHIYDIDPNFPLERWREHRKQIRDKGSDTFESIHRRKDGSTFPVEITANYLSFQNDEFSITFIRDITERKLAAEKINASLYEKEVLLKEIHHRVKNNLQIISSLLSLQSTSINDPFTVAQFQDSQNRIRSMALIHERLYRSEDLARIEFGLYVRDLAGVLVETYRQQSQNIALKVTADGVMLDIDTAIPCGLIVNELVSNALKHAFPNGRAGQIGIEMYRGEYEPEYRLVVCDDGVGMAPGVDYRKTTSLGLQVVNSLTQQINGVIELCSQAGTRFEIRFAGPNTRGKGATR